LALGQNRFLTPKHIFFKDVAFFFKNNKKERNIPFSNCTGP